MNFKNKLNSGKRYLETFAKWIALSVFVGIICGVLGVAFHHAIGIVTEYRKEYKWIILFAPVVGVFIAWLYMQINMKDDKGTNGIFEAVRNGDIVKKRLTPLIFIGTVLTHLVGGSSGREGAALQMGGSIGATIASFLKMKEKDLRIAIICGMSAVFSAMFTTPLTATIFCIEVISVGILHYSALVPTMFSALIAYRVAMFAGVTPVLYILPNAPQSFEQGTALRVLVLSILCGAASILLCVVMKGTSKLYKKYIPSLYIRGAIGGILIILISFLEGTGDYNGAGMDLAARAISGAAIVPWAFLFKLLFTAITLGAGFKGGEIVPTLCIGATFGSIAGVLLGLDPGFAAAIGLVAVFCGAVNGPIASILLSIEFFGSGCLLYFAMACAISFMLSGRYSLYASQKFIYSKLEPTYIDGAS